MLRFLKPLFQFVLFVLPWLLLLGVAFIWWAQFRHSSAAASEEVVEEKGASLIEEVEKLGKMELVKYRIRDVVKYSGAGLIPYTTDDVLLVLTGEAAGCVDLSRIAEEQMRIEADTVFLVLPQPELCYFKINHQETKIYDLGLTEYFDNTQLLEDAFKKSEKDLEKTALQSGLMEQTRQNAILVLTPLLENLTQSTD
jgi:hypothetical protein